MGTPIDEKSEPRFRMSAQEPTPTRSKDSSEEEGTVVDNETIPELAKEKIQTRPRGNSHLTVDTAMARSDDSRALQSPSRSREEANRLTDELKVLQVERQVNQEEEKKRNASQMGRSRSRHDDNLDEFDVATNPLHEKAAIFKPPEHPTTRVARLIKKIHHSSTIVRYVTYIIPLLLIILIPLMLGALLFKRSTVGGVVLVWFCIWLEIVWLTLWAGRILSKCLPWPIGILASLFTNNAKKWRDMAKQLELPAALFFWWLGVEISFLPTMKNHQLSGTHETQQWMTTMNKVIISIFTGTVLNFVEKIIIQLIAISFHQRTYQDRIDLNKFQIGSLTKLYTFSKSRIALEDSDFEAPSGPGSGARTPGQLLESAQKHTRHVFSRFGDVAGRVAGDFSGKQVTTSTHPHQVVLALLHSTPGSQVLARRLYRTFAREDTETIHEEDLKDAFESAEEHSAAFTMFDKDMNGDISMDELEAVCVEIGRERKAITASLKDLDSVVGKLDSVFMFIVLVITLLVFISLISTSAAGVLTSAGSTVLALSWLFSATAQEFLQSVIFVFVKHPFDVGDRVTIYGNTGVQLKGDDYFVKEISLLFTEFKKMEGHVVQAPNSYLNTLFILNQRRSGGLAEAVSITIKFGTTLQQIDELRQRLLEFVTAEKREYQTKILTELRNVNEVHSLDLNVIFFYKSSWQNEGLRLARRNKFICAMMVSMQELGIEGPRMRYPGQKESYPVYLQNLPHVASPGAGRNGTADHPEGIQNEPSIMSPISERRPGAGEDDMHHDSINDLDRHPSIMHSRTAPRRRGESLSAMNRRLDFSLGARESAAADSSGDVFTSRERAASRLPPIVDNENEEPRSRRNTSRGSRPSRDIARSTSRDPGRSFSFGLNRTSTDNDSMSHRDSIHRNRFFGRPRTSTIDAEKGQAQAQHMRGIPEVPTRPPSVHGGVTAPQPARLDARTGLISAQAVRLNTNDTTLRQQMSADSTASQDRSTVPGSAVSATEDWEMRRMRS